MAGPNLNLTLTDDPNGKLIVPGVVMAMKGGACVDQNGSTGDLLVGSQAACAIYPTFTAKLTLSHSQLLQQYFDTVPNDPATPLRTTLCFYHPKAPDRCVGEVTYDPIDVTKPNVVKVTVDLSKANPAGLINLDYRVTFKGSTTAAVPSQPPSGQTLVYDPRVTNKPDQVLTPFALLFTGLLYAFAAIGAASVGHFLYRRIARRRISRAP